VTASESERKHLPSLFSPGFSSGTEKKSALKYKTNKKDYLLPIPQTTYPSPRILVHKEISPRKKQNRTSIDSNRRKNIFFPSPFSPYENEYSNSGPLVDPEENLLNNLMLIQDTMRRSIRNRQRNTGFF
jgi:hypothetical protein